MLTDEETAVLRKKYFPRVEWTERGPLRRLYRVRPAGEGASVTELLLALGEREGFVAPGQHAVTGDAGVCEDAFRQKAADKSVALIFGTEMAAHWCDIAVDAPNEEGWQLMAVRSEEGENLTALAHSEGLLRFRRA